MPSPTYCVRLCSVYEARTKLQRYLVRVVLPFEEGACRFKEKLAGLPLPLPLPGPDYWYAHVLVQVVYPHDLEYFRNTLGFTPGISSHRIAPHQIESNQIKSNRIESNQILSNLIKSYQIKSNQIKLNQIESNQIKSSQIKSNQIESNHITSNQIKSNQIKTSRSKSQQIVSRETASNRIKSHISSISTRLLLVHTCTAHTSWNLQRTGRCARAQLLSRNSRGVAACKSTVNPCDDIVAARMQRNKTKQKQTNKQNGKMFLGRICLDLGI